MQAGHFYVERPFLRERMTGVRKSRDDGPVCGGLNAPLWQVPTLRVQIVVVNGAKLFTTLTRHVVNLPRR